MLLVEVVDHSDPARVLAEAQVTLTEEVEPQDRGGGGGGVGGASSSGGHSRSGGGGAFVGDGGDVLALGRNRTTLVRTPAAYQIDARLCNYEQVSSRARERARFFIGPFRIPSGAAGPCESIAEPERRYLARAVV